MLLASFKSDNEADAAIGDLMDMGYDSNEISVVTKERARVRDHGGEGHDVASGAASGATTGGVIGGLAGLLAGAGVFPALAGLLIGGPIAAALGLTGMVAAAASGAVTGAVAGGLIGALTKLGVPEEEAKQYDEDIKSGGILISVPVEDEEEEDEVRDIYEENGAQRVSLAHRASRE